MEAYFRGCLELFKRNSVIAISVAESLSSGMGGGAVNMVCSELRYVHDYFNIYMCA